MNGITTPVNAPETLGMKQQQKANSKPDDGEFRDLLSNALKPGANKPDPVSQTPTKKDVEKDSSKVQSKAQDAKTEKEISEPTTEKVTETESKSETKDNPNQDAPQNPDTSAIAAAQSQVITLPVVTTVVATENTGVPLVQAIAATQGQTQSAKPAAPQNVAANTSVDAQTVQPQQTAPTLEQQTVAATPAQQTVETKPAQSQNVEVATQQTVTVPTVSQPASPIIQGQQPQNTQPQDTALHNQSVQAQTAATQVISQTSAQQTSPIAATSSINETAKTLQVNVQQTVGEQVVDTAVKPADNTTNKPVQEVAANPDIKPTEVAQTKPVAQNLNPIDAAQAKFDEMMAKASQELGLKKPAIVAETPVTTVEAATTQQSVSQQVQTSAVETPEKSDSTTVDSLELAQPAEKVPLTETTANDEAMLGLISQKPAEFVSEIARTEQPQVANPVKVPEQAEQIHAQVLKNMENDKMEFNMQLNPKELGKIEVKMILESGKLSVEIMSANAKSTELLTKQAESLIASLKQSNVEVSSVSVVTASSTASGNMNSEYNQNNFQNQAGAGRQSNNSGGSKQNNNTSSEKAEKQDSNVKSSPQRILNYSV